MSYLADKNHLLVDYTIRLILWSLFLLFDQTDPFIRVIQPEELWQYKYPSLSSYVPTSYLWILVFGVPLTLIFYDHFHHKNKYLTSRALLSLSLNYGLNGFLTTLLKVVVGRPRPNFYSRCFPDGIGDSQLHCTGRRESVMDGRKSFPSGHSSFAFASMVFVSLYLSEKLDIPNSRGRGDAWKLLAVIAPILVATLIGISRTCDYHHHWQDVCAGAALGTIICYLCYRLYIPKICNEDQAIIL